MRFQIVSASGGFRAEIVGGNNEQMFLSEVYTSKESAKNAIRVVKKGAAIATVLDATTGQTITV